MLQQKRGAPQGRPVLFVKCRGWKLGQYPKMQVDYFGGAILPKRDRLT